MDEDNKKEASTTVEVPHETQENDKEQSDPKEATNKPTNTQPETADTDADSTEKAQADGVTKKVDTIIDMLTSVLNRLPNNDGDSKENNDPEKDNDNSSNSSDTLEDFENLL